MLTHSRTTLLVAAALVLAPMDAATSQVTRPRPGSGAPPATLARRAPAPDAAAMLDAYRAALRQPSLQRSARGALQRQLRANRPIAIVDGHWVTPVDLAPLYRDRGVHAAIVSALPGATPQALAADVGARLGLAFTPMEFADVVIGDPAQELGAAVGLNAFYENRTDEAITVAILVGLGTGFVAGVAGNAFWSWWTSEETPIDPNTNLPINHPQADPDGDGQPNASDHDDDADGAPDSEDQHPHDPSKTMCPPELCGNRAVIAFGSGMTDQVLGVVLHAFGTATTAGETASLAPAGRLPAFTLRFPATGLR